MQHEFPALCVALDVPSGAEALTLAESVAEHADIFKIGLELLTTLDTHLIEQIAHLAPVFADWKLHDIPRTVEAACRNISRLPVSYLTVHTAGGKDMLAAARSGVGDSGPALLGITVLTSLDPNDELVLERSALAHDVGLDGIVCAASDLDLVRTQVTDMLCVVPGIRFDSGDSGDQKRVGTPGAAIEAGADILVVGRPIVQAPDPQVAAARLKAIAIASRRAAG